MKRQLWGKAAAFLGFLFAGWIAVSPAMAQTTVRPIEDFISQQGTFCFPDGFGGCFLVDPPVPNFLFFKREDGRCASVDYAGVAARYIFNASGGSINLGTTMTGTVRERPQPEGFVEVRVTLRTTNALFWVADQCSGGTLLFGSRAVDVLAGAAAAQGDSSLTLTFRNTAPGAPLPDLFELLAFPDLGRSFLSLTFTASGEGDLHAAFGVPEGTDGTALVIVVNLTGTANNGAIADGIPVDRVELQAIGN